MKQNIPRTPFSTRLSGSAKETELRLRNIFQWKKKRPPVVVIALILVLMVGCFSLVSFIPGNVKAAREMTLNLIEGREIVPASYLRLLDGETRRMAEEYNETTEILYGAYEKYATQVADSYSVDSQYTLQMKHVWGGHKPIYHYFIKRVSKLALYPDAYFRLREDPYVDTFLKREAGGSGALWAMLIHNDTSVGAEVEKTAQEYFVLVDALTERLTGA